MSETSRVTPKIDYQILTFKIWVSVSFVKAKGKRNICHTDCFTAFVKSFTPLRAGGGEGKNLEI